MRILFGLLTLVSIQVHSQTVQVAVASNFAGTLEEISKEFEQSTGHKVQISSAATGKLYVQIKNGAPFDVFLSADTATPREIIKDGLAVSGRQLTYAVGKLVLWSTKPHFVDREGEVLRGGRFQHLSIANPKTAPYGAAAMEVLAQMGLIKSLKPKLVEGENIAQAHQFVASGNAELGFVSLSQVSLEGQLRAGSAWFVPQDLYSPIRQDAVLLNKGKDNAAAEAFLVYLQSDQAKRHIESMGYALSQ